MRLWRSQKLFRCFFLSQFYSNPLFPSQLNPLQGKSKKLADFKAVLAEDSAVVAQCADLKSRWRNTWTLVFRISDVYFIQSERLCLKIPNAWTWGPLVIIRSTSACFFNGTDNKFLNFRVLSCDIQSVGSIIQSVGPISDTPRVIRSWRLSRRKTMTWHWTFSQSSLKC